LLAVTMLLLPAPEGLSVLGWRVAAIGLLMAAWWMTEAVPLAATALLPLPFFPALGILTVEETAAAYANPLVFLFLGGFLLARALSVWQLDRRLAGSVLRLAGQRPRRLVGGVMAMTAFLSLWITNTATAMVMLPIGQALAARAVAEDGTPAGDDAFATALLLGIAYAATIGGMGTLIGTPPNALFAAYMAQTQGIEIGFAEWMLVGLPVVIVLLPLAWWLLTAVVFRLPREAAVAVAELPGSAGPASPAQRRVAGLLILAIALWLGRPLLAELVPGLPLSDAGIAIGVALLLFLLPAGSLPRRPLLLWSEAVAIRWDVLLLFGGGLALAEGISVSGLAPWVGSAMQGLEQWLPFWVLILFVGALVVSLGELASNTAVAAVFLPVAGAVALGMHEPAVTLALPVALAATLGFMLPVATPPNAIVYGSGRLAAHDMLRAGLLLDAAGLIVVLLGALTLGRWVFS
jgi:sodium-dependent dicarboxylate transporter 2/3/5